MGLSIPRPAMRLVSKDLQKVRMVTSGAEIDYTELADATAEKILDAQEPWDGFILKKDSPSCGLERVKVYGSTTIPSRTGEGLFARRLRERYPLLPVIEEGRLADPEQREHFVTQIFAYHRLRQVTANLSEIQVFHRNYKLILMEHSPAHYQKLGRIVANSAGIDPSEVLSQYVLGFVEGLRVPSTPQRRMNVLQHVLGYFKKMIDPGEKKQILESIQEYRDGILPLMAPLGLLHYMVRKFSITYLEQQFYFYPYPKALGLRKWL
jgi:uncharacterized protein YbgA (DUF1722 family)